MPATLASRGDRLAAATADAVIGIIVAIPFGFWTGELQAVIHGELPSTSVYIENILASWGFYFLINTYLLKKYGQTVGKRLLSIRIADHRTEAVPPFRRLVLRIASSTVPGIFGIVGALFSIADLLFIFTSDRRCIHDWIAGTRVLKV